MPTLQVKPYTGAGNQTINTLPDLGKALEAASLPAVLPDTQIALLASAAKQDTAQTSLTSIDTKLTSQATAAKQDTGNTSLGSIDTKLSSQATAAKQDTGNTSIAAVATNLGAVADAAASSDGGSFSLISLLKRLIGKFPASLGQTNMAGSPSVNVASDQSPIAVKIDQTTPGTTEAVTVKALGGIGSLTETAPGSDTASSGLNGRLQRIAQNLSSLIALLPTALGSGTSATSLKVVVASDQAAIKTKTVPFKVSVNFTRPTDTTPYAVGDAISNSTSAPVALSFAIGANGQTAIITKAVIISTQKGSPLLLANLWLFGASLASATFLDNGALDIDNTAFITGGSVIPLVETSSVTSRARTAATGIRIPVVLDASGNAAGLLQALNAYTPANAEVFTIILWGELE